MIKTPEPMERYRAKTLSDAMRRATVIGEITPTLQRALIDGRVRPVDLAPAQRMQEHLRRLMRRAFSEHTAVRSMDEPGTRSAAAETREHLHLCADHALRVGAISSALHSELVDQGMSAVSALKLRMHAEKIDLEANNASPGADAGENQRAQRQQKALSELTEIMRTTPLRSVSTGARHLHKELLHTARDNPQQLVDALRRWPAHALL